MEGCARPARESIRLGGASMCRSGVCLRRGAGENAERSSVECARGAGGRALSGGCRRRRGCRCRRRRGCTALRHRRCAAGAAPHLRGEPRQAGEGGICGAHLTISRSAPSPTRWCAHGAPRWLLFAHRFGARSGRSPRQPPTVLVRAALHMRTPLQVPNTHGHMQPTQTAQGRACGSTCVHACTPPWLAGTPNPPSVACTPHHPRSCMRLHMRPRSCTRSACAPLHVHGGCESSPRAHHSIGEESSLQQWTTLVQSGRRRSGGVRRRCTVLCYTFIADPPPFLSLSLSHTLTLSHTHTHPVSLTCSMRRILTSPFSAGKECFRSSCRRSASSAAVSTPGGGREEQEREVRVRV